MQREVCQYVLEDQSAIKVLGTVRNQQCASRRFNMEINQIQQFVILITLSQVLYNNLISS